MKKQIKVILTLSTMAMVSLTSCGASKGYAGEVDPTVDTRGTTIEFWSGFGSDISAQLSDIVLKDFTDKYDISVTHTTKGGYDGLQKAINLSASSVTYPNIAVGYPDHFASYIDSDIQLRLDTFIASDAQIPATRTNEDGSTFNEAAKIDMDDFYSFYMTEVKNLEFDEDGKGYTLGLPFNKSTELFVYNKTFFDNEKVKAAGIAFPETWDDVETQGVKIKEFVKAAMGKVLGADGNVYTLPTDATAAGTTVLLNLISATEDTFFPFSYDSTANLFITGLRQWGATYTTVDTATRKGYIGFDTGDSYNKALDFLTFMANLAKKGVLAAPKSFGGTDLYCSSYYTNFQTLGNIGSSAGLTHYASGSFYQKNGYYSAMTHIPYKSADNKIVISQGTNLCMLDKGSEAEREASWKAIKYLATEGNGTFAALTGYYPVCKTATASKAYQDFLAGTGKDDNEKNKVSGAVANAEIYDAEGSGWTKFVDPGFNGSSSIRSAVDATMSTILTTKDVNAKSELDALIASLRDYRRGA